MKKYLYCLILSMIFSCKPSVKLVASNKLYEILDQQETGGASIHFFEILTEANEIVMLENDESLKGKIEANASKTSNFVLLNMGEKPSGGYKIGVSKVEETDKNIVITVQETNPNPNSMTTQVITTPYCIVRINSKKQILIQ